MHLPESTFKIRSFWCPLSKTYTHQNRAFKRPLRYLSKASQRPWRAMLKAFRRFLQVFERPSKSVFKAFHNVFQRPPKGCFKAFFKARPLKGCWKDVWLVLETYSRSHNTFLALPGSEALQTKQSKYSTGCLTLFSLLNNPLNDFVRNHLNIGWKNTCRSLVPLWSLRLHIHAMF